MSKDGERKQKEQIKRWAEVLKKQGWKATATALDICVDLNPEPSAESIRLRRATDGRLHLFSWLASGRERPFERVFDPSKDASIYELAARFNAGRWFELLEVVEPGSVVYKVMLLTGFRGEEPTDDQLVAAVRVHHSRLKTVATGLQELILGAAVDDVADRLLAELTLWHPLQDS